MEQTAVEWLINWMGKNEYFIGNDLIKAIEQAKAIEKERIMKAYDDGAIETMREEEGLDISKDQNGEESERYYNEKYGK